MCIQASSNLEGAKLLKCRGGALLQRLVSIVDAAKQGNGFGRRVKRNREDSPDARQAAKRPRTQENSVVAAENASEQQQPESWAQVAARAAASSGGKGTKNSKGAGGSKGAGKTSKGAAGANAKGKEAGNPADGKATEARVVGRVNLAITPCSSTPLGLLTRTFPEGCIFTVAQAKTELEGGMAVPDGTVVLCTTNALQDICV